MRLSILVLVLTTGLATAQSEFSKMDFLIGEWMFDAKNRLADGSYQSQEYYSKVSRIHNGFASRDDFHFKNQNGEWVLYGSTIRSYDQVSGKWKMLWYNYNLSFVTEMEGVYRNGEFHFDGKGKDEKGDYLEKITFYNIEKDSYDWKSDKSYDGGETWIRDFFSYSATRVK